MNAARILLFLALVLVLSGCGSAGSGSSLPVTAPTQSTLPGQTTTNATLGRRSRTNGCRVRGVLPDPLCTPGAIFPAAGAKQICVLGYSKKVRRVSSSTKRKAYSEYGIVHHRAGEYEVDHLISLELGGSNSIANLWPEAASPAPGFHQKDQVENYLHRQVCDGKMSLRQAQEEIATNWLAVYRKMPH